MTNNRTIILTLLYNKGHTPIHDIYFPQDFMPTTQYRSKLYVTIKKPK